MAEMAGALLTVAAGGPLAGACAKAVPGPSPVALAALQAGAKKLHAASKEMMGVILIYV